MNSAWAGVSTIWCTSTRAPGACGWIRLLLIWQLADLALAEQTGGGGAAVGARGEDAWISGQ
jgi:hypothetical protein